MEEKNDFTSPTTCFCGGYLHYRIVVEQGIKFHEYFCPKNCGKYSITRIRR